MNPDAAQRQTGKVRVHVYLWSKTRPADKKQASKFKKDQGERQKSGGQAVRETDRQSGW